LKIYEILANAGVRKINVWGGEVHLRQDFYEILKPALETFQSVSVQTNGVSETYLGIIHAEYPNLGVHISLEGWGKDDEIIRGKGHFLRAKRNVEILAKQLGRDLTIRTTIFNGNNIIPLLDMALQNNCNWVGVRFKPLGRGGKLAKFQPSKERLADIYRLIASLRKSFETQFMLEETQFYLYDEFLSQKYQSYFMKKGFACEWGHRITIDVDGAVYPCFPAGTQVQLADGTVQNIENVKENDVLLSFNPQHRQWEHKRCTACYSLTEEVVEVKTNSGSIRCSIHQPFYVFDGVNITAKAVNDLKRGDYLLKAHKLPIAGKTQEVGGVRFPPPINLWSKFHLQRFSSSFFNVNQLKHLHNHFSLMNELYERGMHFVKVKTITQQGTEKVYDIHVEDTHTFVVEGGFIVHNCPYAMTPSMALGNIYKDDIDTIEGNYKELIEQRKNTELLPQCNICPLRDICKGGCSILSLFNEDNLLGDPLCPIPLLLSKQKEGG